MSQHPPLPELMEPHFTADLARQRVGEIYAKAFLGSIDGHTSPDAILRDLGDIAGVLLQRTPRFQEMLASPRIAAEEKIASLDRVFRARVTPEVLRFLKVLARHGRLDCLREVYQAVRRLWNVRNGVVEVRVDTAQPLDDRLKHLIEAALTKQFQSPVEVQSRIDPDLIGGLRIRVGDLVFDASVAQRLRRLAAETMEKSVQQIREGAHRFASDSPLSNLA